MSTDHQKSQVTLLDKWKFVLAVAQDSRLSHAAKVLILLLADHHNALTGRCDPSIARLETLAGLSNTRVKVALRALVAAGWVERDERPGRTSTYVIRFDRISMLPETQAENGRGEADMGSTHPGRKRPGGEAENGRGGRPKTAYEQEKGNRENNNGGSATLARGGGSTVAILVTEGEFNTWADTHPGGHRDPHRTRPAYVAARRAGASADELLEGARRYRDACMGRAPGMVAHPAGWLKDRRWLDDPAPPRSATATDTRLSAYDQAMAAIAAGRFN